jgi:Protein of unknown function (DUF1565)/Right handed beta helix region
MYELVGRPGIREAIGVLIALSACQDVSREVADAGSADDAAPMADADLPLDARVFPGATIRVSSAGSDASDGAIAPVRTLGRAIDIATEFPAVTAIFLDAGRYGAETGEVFPYAVRAGLTVAGPFDASAALVGSGTGTGIILTGGEIRNLDLESHAVAVIARGPGAISNVHVRASGVAVHQETTGELSLSRVEITGRGGACEKGIELVGDAVLTATDLTTRDLGVSLELSDRSTATLAKVTATGDRACRNNMIRVRSSGMFSLSDSILQQSSLGVTLSGDSAPLRASLANVTIRNIAGGAIGGSEAIVQITGGELSGNSGGGVGASGGRWTLTDVVITGSAASGISLLGMRDQEPVMMVVRGCTITDHRQGISISDFADIDLGTETSPGNNIIQSNEGVGVHVTPSEGEREISAIGNTWRPRLQGADIDGRYTRGTRRGPIDFVPGNNFAIVSGLWSLKL